MPEDAGEPVPRAPVSQPRPREETGDRDDTSVTRRSHDREEGLGVGMVMGVSQALPVMVHATDGHRPGMQSAPPGRLRLCGVASHAVSSSCACLFPRLRIPQRYAEEGASISIKRVQATAYSVRSSVAPASGSG